MLSSRLAGFRTPRRRRTSDFSAMTDKRLLLLSNGSELIGEEPTEFAHGAVRDFLGGGVRTVLFVPFAAVVRSFDEYAARVRRHFGSMGFEVESIHQTDEAGAAVKS